MKVFRFYSLIVFLSDREKIIKIDRVQLKNLNGLPTTPPPPPPPKKKKLAEFTIQLQILTRVPPLPSHALHYESTSYCTLPKLAFLETSPIFLLPSLYFSGH